MVLDFPCQLVAGGFYGGLCLGSVVQDLEGSEITGNIRILRFVLMLFSVIILQIVLVGVCTSG